MDYPPPDNNQTVNQTNNDTGVGSIPPMPAPRQPDEIAASDIVQNTNGGMHDSHQPQRAEPSAPESAGNDDEVTDDEEFRAPGPAANHSDDFSTDPVAKPRRGGTGRGGIITLRHLIDDGILEPGEDVLSVEYKGSTHIATLLPDGRIVCTINGQDMTFESPSAFSIYLKRLVNPTRKADDGWKTVKYQGKLLESYKADMARKRLGLGEGGDSTAALAALAAMEPRSKRARTDQTMEPRFKFGVGIATIAASLMPERPRRQRKAPPRFATIGVDDEHTLQHVEPYGPGAQPFTVRVAPAAEVVMDFHAHLSMNEVIGLLAGSWDSSAKCITVIRAYPVKELSTEDDSINVEMDPEDQVSKMDDIAKAGMKVVGWYHSHPTFQAEPSTVDIYNQVLQQHAHREGGGEDGAPYVEPYVAAIVSPYDRSISTPVSSMSWFYVHHAPGAVPAEGQRPDEVGCVGRSLATEPSYEPLGQLENLVNLQKELENLAKVYAATPDRANLEGTWIDGGLKAEKLVESLIGRLRNVPGLDGMKLSKFANKMLFSTRAVWNIYGKPLVAGITSIATAAANATTQATTAPGSTAISNDQGDGIDAEKNINAAEEAPTGLRRSEDDEPISEDEATEDDS